MAVGQADDLRFGLAAAAVAGLEHPPDSDRFLRFEGLVKAHFHPQGNPWTGEAPDCVGHQLIKQRGQDAAVDHLGPALVFPGEGELGFRGQLRLGIPHLDLKPQGVVLTANETIVVGQGGVQRAFAGVRFFRSHMPVNMWY